MSEINETQNQEVFKFSEYLQAYNSQAYGINSYMLSPQLLNSSLKDMNMLSSKLSPSQVETLIMAPHRFEQELRKLSTHYRNTIGLYGQTIDLKSNMLDFDWEFVPYREDGKPITVTEFKSKAYKDSYNEMSKFFNAFDHKNEFNKVLWNMCMYDAYIPLFREYNGKYYFQELPSTHTVIDANSYLGYLSSFDLSYFMNSGVDINAYPASLRTKYRNALKQTKVNYNPNLPNRNGKWVSWTPLSPDEAWVFKFNDKFAGIIPPLLSVMIDCAKIDRYKDLEDAKKELEAFKLILGEVPLNNNKNTGQKVDNFAISADEVGKFNAALDSVIGGKANFKAMPLHNIKAFDFSPSANEANLLETELKNIMLQSGTTTALSMVDGVNMASSAIYKLFNATLMESLYSQFETFCEYHINKKTSTYKFKIKFVGNMFNREERRKNADSDMDKGIITTSIFSSRGISPTDGINVLTMMKTQGVVELLTPIQNAYTMSSKDSSTKNGRTEKPESELSDGGADTRNKDSNGSSEVV